MIAPYQQATRIMYACGASYYEIGQIDHYFLIDGDGRGKAYEFREISAAETEINTFRDNSRRLIARLTAYQREELREIARTLKEGYLYGKQINDSRACFSVSLSYDADKKLWRWKHGGASANKATIGELAWILAYIFKCSPRAFLHGYERRQ